MFYSTNHWLNRKLRCWITASIFWLSSCHIADAKSQYRRFISRQKTYNWNSNKNVEVQIQEIQSKTGRYYQIGGAIWKPGGAIWKPGGTTWKPGGTTWKPGGTIWSWVQLAPPDYLGWPGTVVPCIKGIVLSKERRKSRSNFCMGYQSGNIDLPVRAFRLGHELARNCVFYCRTCPGQ